MNTLTMYGQKEMVEYVKALSHQEQEGLLEELAAVDTHTLERQKSVLHQPQYHQRDVIPLTNYDISGNASHKIQGLEAIATGQVACLVLAGGQGTRLGFSGPKGAFPITAIKKKSLFQLLAEKTLAASRQAHHPLLLAIMTSPLNHDETVAFFKENKFFGLESTQVSFFSQEMLPFLDSDGNIFLASPTDLAWGPDGNGNALFNLVHSGIWKQWMHHGVRYVNIVLVDNPLADPFDAELVGYTIAHHADMTIKSTLREEESENVGVIALEKGKTVVVEYMEMAPSEYSSRDSEGVLRYRCANLSLFCLGMDFIKSVGQQKDLQPLHKAFKATPYLDTTGTVVTPKEPNAWKFERFIFDVLPHATKICVLVYPREHCFAPLKNASGPYSPATVSAALMERDRTVLQEISGVKVEGPLELSPDFYYPTDSLLEKWKGKAPQAGYIEA